MFQSIEPQNGASELQPHPHRLALRGRPGDVRFPSLCAHCGNTSSERIEVAKVFREATADDTTRYVVQSAAVPFCDACLAAHHTRETRPTRVEMLRSSFVGMNMIGAVFPALAALFLVYLALGDAMHGRSTRVLVELGLGAFFALIAWAQGSAVWRENRRFRVPPQTEVTRSFDFSGDVAPAFEPARFECTLRDDRFAQAFRSLNAEREYRAESGAARTERRTSSLLTWAFGAAILAFGAWALWKDLFG